MSFPKAAPRLTACAPNMWERPEEHEFHAIVASAAMERSAGQQLTVRLGLVWIHVGPSTGRLPTQGWKLHVSSDVQSARRTLARVVPILIEQGATFKVAGSSAVLAALNEGAGGLAQIGKLITVYPRNDAQAKQLASALDEATRGSRGPRIRGDRRLHPSSVIHYRFGSFGGEYLHTPIGEVVSAVRSPDGSLEPEIRSLGYRLPKWKSDIFESQTDPARREELIGERYRLTGVVHRGPRGDVATAVDIKSLRPCIVKRRDLLEVSSPRQGAPLRHEAATLRALSDSGSTPEFVDLIESGTHLNLIIELVGGDPLDRHIARLAACGRLPSKQDLVMLAQGITKAVGSVHERGFIHGDLSPANCIVYGAGEVRLIDLESASERGDGSVQGPSKDIYGIGALMYFAATGIEVNPGASVEPGDIVKRNARVGDSLATVISRCLSPKPGRGFSDIGEVESAWRAANRSKVSAIRRPAEEPGTRRREARSLARSLGQLLCADAESLAEGVDHIESDEAVSISPLLCRDVNSGIGGRALALAELVDEFSDPAYRTALEKLISLLKSGKVLSPFHPGLYVGEAGVAVALLRAGQVLDDPSLINLACQQTNAVARQPFQSADIFNGTAGRLRAHLMIWDATGDTDQLKHAHAAADQLLKVATSFSPNEVAWTTREGYGSLSGVVYPGYAHGAAGIGDALLDWYEESGDRATADAVRGAADWLARQAMAVLDDGTGLDWTRPTSDVPGWATWCHGAAGVGRFFARLARLGLWAAAAEMTERAARSAAHIRSLGPVQCHGLAGSIELLLDVYQLTGQPSYFADASELMDLLVPDLRLYSPEPIRTSPRSFNAGYMVGLGGIVMCLLRMGSPEVRPTQISRAGFRYRRSDTSIDALATEVGARSRPQAAKLDALMPRENQPDLPG